MRSKYWSLLIIIVLGAAGYFHQERFSRGQSVESHLSTPASAGNSTFWPGLPVSMNEKVTALTRIGYTVGYSTRLYDPIWDAYSIKSVSNPKSAGRPSEFTPDPDMPPQDQVETREFARTGFDRGHMAPNWAVSISFGREAQIQTFYTTNIAPQRPECNRGIWEDLEKIEANDYARRYDGVVTFDGPIFDSSSTEGIGRDHRIRVPVSFYKIIVRKFNGQPGVLAFIVPQYPVGRGRDGLEKYLVSVDQIEAETGVQFLTALPREQQAELKAQAAQRMW